MATVAMTKRFLETTRGQILARLRRDARTVEDLAAALALSDNAVRNHLSTPERDLLVKSDSANLEEMNAVVRRYIKTAVAFPAIVFENAHRHGNSQRELVSTHDAMLA
jgi:DNA-binding transcriptional ArsR family regulator